MINDNVNSIVMSSIPAVSHTFNDTLLLLSKLIFLFKNEACIVDRCWLLNLSSTNLSNIEVFPTFPSLKLNQIIKVTEYTSDCNNEK